MNAFLAQHASAILGVLTGFDRILLRGTLQSLFCPTTMNHYLMHRRIPFKEFGGFANSVTQRIKAKAQELASSLKRPFQYLVSSATSKEETARKLLQAQPVKEGLIAVLTCLEPCYSYDVRGNYLTRQLELVLRQRKCLHAYFYMLDPTFGFMHARLQLWFPFTIQACINGREWLARQMDAVPLEYTRKDNCFTCLSDPVRSQTLMDMLLKIHWRPLLNRIQNFIHPLHSELFKTFHQEYYWTIAQSEWATDIIFKDASHLAELYPLLVRHAMLNLHSPDVLRFLGRTTRAHTGVESDLKRREEGVRVKHFADGNSIKMYDKQGKVLRVECTVNNPEVFYVYRKANGNPKSKLGWRSLRKSVVDVRRRAEVCQAANARYLEAMSAVKERQALGMLTESFCRPVQKEGRHYRALNPWSPDDAALLQAISSGAYAVNGFRNRDIRQNLYGIHTADKERLRQAAAVSRKFRLLRAHSLIRKVPKSHRYMLTAKGQTAIAALSSAYRADIESLLENAA